MKKTNKKFPALLIFFVIVQISGFFFIINSAKEEMLKNEAAKKESLKNPGVKTSDKYVIYLGESRVSFKELNNTTILYNDVTMKLINGKLKTIAVFGDSELSPEEKKSLIRNLKNIEKAQPATNKNFNEKEEKPIIVSGSNFYIKIFKNRGCYIYKIMNNSKTVSRYFKYCPNHTEGEKNGK